VGIFFALATAAGALVLAAFPVYFHLRNAGRPKVEDPAVDDFGNLWLWIWVIEYLPLLLLCLIALVVSVLSAWYAHRELAIEKQLEIVEGKRRQR
jgi:hypothetical protein